MCTPFTQMITYCAVKPSCHKWGLNPQMWIIVSEYHNHIYDTLK